MGASFRAKTNAGKMPLLKFFDSYRVLKKRGMFFSAFSCQSTQKIIMTHVKHYAAIDK
jgi:hypothetical protein